MPPQDLMRQQQQPQMTEDEIRTERQRLIDEQHRIGKITEKERDSYYDRYGIVSPDAIKYAKPKISEYTPESREIAERTGRAIDLRAKPEEPPTPKVKPTAQLKYEADLSYDQAVNAAIMNGFPVEDKGDKFDWGKLGIDDYWRLKNLLASYGQEPVTKGRKPLRNEREKDEKRIIEILGIQPIDIAGTRSSREALTPEDVVRTGVPTWEEFLSRAAPANPNTTEEELKKYYDETYGK